MHGGTSTSWHVCSQWTGSRGAPVGAPEKACRIPPKEAGFHGENWTNSFGGNENPWRTPAPRNPLSTRRAH